MSPINPSGYVLRKNQIFPKLSRSTLICLFPFLPPCLEQTMPNSPACRAGEDPPSPFFSPGLYRWIARSSKNPSRVLYSSVDAPFHELCTSCRWHVGHIATRSTCQAPNNSAEQQGAYPTHTGPVLVMRNETSNHNAAPSQTDEATIISHFGSPSSQTT